MKRFFMDRLVFFILVVAPIHSVAGKPSVAVNIAPDRAQLFGGKSVDEVNAEINNKLVDDLRLDSVSKYLAAISNVHPFTNKGVGVDYGTVFDNWILGGSASVYCSRGCFNSLTGEVKNDSGLPGADAQFPSGASLMVGLNLGFLGWSETFYYANCFYLSSDLKSTSFPDGSLGVTLSNLGAHLQWKFFLTHFLFLTILLRYKHLCIHDFFLLKD